MSDTGPMTLDLMPAIAGMTTSAAGMRAAIELDFAQPRHDEPLFSATLEWMAQNRLK